MPPIQYVITPSTVEEIVTVIAENPVIAFVAAQGVVPVASEDRVVPGLCVDGIVSASGDDRVAVARAPDHVRTTDGARTPRRGRPWEFVVPLTPQHDEMSPPWNLIGAVAQE